MPTKLIITFVQCSLLIVAVVLNGAHAKDIMKSHAKSSGSYAKLQVDDVMAKATADLHNHIDKQTLKTFHAAGDGYQTDGRSLRLVKEVSSARDTLRLQFQIAFQIWLRVLAAKLML